MAAYYLDKDGTDELALKVKQLVGSGGVAVDDAPASGSANAVSSGGVYTALAGKADSSHAHSASDVTSGVLTVNRGGTGAQTASRNHVFAGPWGQDGSPTFRALHSSDIPTLSPTKSNITGGTVAISEIAAANGASTAITFNSEFNGTPVVVVGMTSTQTALTGACSAYAMNVTSAGFTLRRQNNSTSARQIGAQWVAFTL